MHSRDREPEKQERKKELAEMRMTTQRDLYRYHSLSWISQCPSISSLLTGEQSLWKIIYDFSGYRKREILLSNGGRENSSLSTLNHICVSPACMCKWDEAGAKKRRVFPHGDPFGWRWVSENTFIFHNVLCMHAHIQEKRSKTNPNREVN